MLEEKRDYLGISLWITSIALTPEMITEIVGFEPTYIQRRGEPIGKTKRVYEEHSWKLGERFYAEPNEYIGKRAESFFETFLERLRSASSRIKTLSAANSVSIAIIYNVRDMPYIGLTREQVELIAGFGASANFDVIVYGRDLE
jgi:hypothetical protein